MEKHPWYTDLSVFFHNLRDVAALLEFLELLLIPDQRHFCKMSCSPVPETGDLFPVADAASQNRIFLLRIKRQALSFLLF
jgi:hypothetical protein